MTLYKPPSWPGAKQVIEDIQHLESPGWWPNNKAPKWAEEIREQFGLPWTLDSVSIARRLIIHEQEEEIARLRGVIASEGLRSELAEKHLRLKEAVRILVGKIRDGRDTSRNEEDRKRFWTAFENVKEMVE